MNLLMLISGPVPLLPWIPRGEYDDGYDYIIVCTTPSAMFTQASSSCVTHAKMVYQRIDAPFACFGVDVMERGI